jgi:hypothetical protein
MILSSNENINEENKENRFKSRKLKFYINNKKTSNNVPPKKKKKKFIFYSKNTDNNDKFPNKNNIKQSTIITSEDKENNSFRIDKNNIYQTSKKQKRRISELFLGPKDIFSNRINDVNESNQIGARILNNNAFENFATIKKK